MRGPVVFTERALNAFAFVHGGAITAALDDAVGHTVMLASGSAGGTVATVQVNRPLAQLFWPWYHPHRENRQIMFEKCSLQQPETITRWRVQVNCRLRKAPPSGQTLLLEGKVTRVDGRKVMAPRLDRTPS